MLKKQLLAGILLFSSLVTGYSQTDTTFFNTYWTKTSRDSASFYRPAPQKKDNGYLIKDYYKSGALQMQGISTSLTEDAFDGEITWYYENGKVSQKVLYSAGLREGEATMFDTDQTILSKGIYKGGEPFSGSFYLNDELYNTINYYEDGLMSRQISIGKPGTSKAKVEATFEQGQMKEISFYDQFGKLVGKGSDFDENKSITNGEMVDYLFNPMSVESVQKIKDGKYVGPATGYFLNGKIKYLRYVDEEKNRTKEVYYNQNGKACDSIVYKDLSPYNGTQYIYYMTVYKASTCDFPEIISTYKNGELNGPYQEFYPNGHIKSSVTCQNNEIVGTKTTCDSLGKEKYTVTYKQNSPWDGTIFNQGYSIETYKDGKLSAETKYHTNGKPMSVFNETNGLTVYDTTGKVLAKLEYRNGEPYNGKNITLDENVISHEEVYKNGEKVSECYYSEGKPTEKAEYKANERINTQYYSSGKPKKQVKYINDDERETTCYELDGTFIGTLKTNENGELSGTKCEFDDNDSLTQVEEYRNNVVIRKKIYYRNAVLADIDYFGQSVFNNPEGNKEQTCQYKDGNPYNGTVIEYDDYYKTVKTKSSYTNGVLNGNQTSYTFDAETVSNKITHIEPYVNGVKEGVEKEFYNEKLVRSVTYKNGSKEGPAEFFDKNENVLSQAVYKGDAPYEGRFIEYSYDYEISGETSYKDGQPDGTFNYYYEGQLTSTEFYKSGVLEKTVTFEYDKPKYILIYKDGEPFEGSKLGYNEVSIYKKGVLVEVVVKNTDSDGMQSREVFDGNMSTLTEYYKDGKTKSVEHRQDHINEGKKVTYTESGSTLAEGQYKEGLPSSGKFIFFAKEQENAWLELTVNKGVFTISEIIDGKAVRRLKYEVLSTLIENLGDEMGTYLKTVEAQFPNYQMGTVTSVY